MDIQKDLPNMPAEIIEVWLKPIAQREDYGWPPGEYNAWHYELGSDSRLAYLAGLRWDKKEMALNPDMIDKHDMNSVMDLFQTHVVGISMSSAASQPEHYSLFRDHCDYLKEHGTFINPIVLEETGAGLHVLDGFYRLCAYFYLSAYLQSENTEIKAARLAERQSVWLGKQA